MIKKGLTINPLLNNITHTSTERLKISPLDEKPDLNDVTYNNGYFSYNPEDKHYQNTKIHALIDITKEDACIQFLQIAR